MARAGSPQQFDFVLVSSQVEISHFIILIFIYLFYLFIDLFNFIYLFIIILYHYKLIDLTMENPSDLSHKNTGVGMAPTLDTGVLCGWHLVKGVQRNCVWVFNLSTGLSLSSLPISKDAR